MMKIVSGQGMCEFCDIPTGEPCWFDGDLFISIQDCHVWEQIQDGREEGIRNAVNLKDGELVHIDAGATVYKTDVVIREGVLHGRA